MEAILFRPHDDMMLIQMLYQVSVSDLFEIKIKKNYKRGTDCQWEKVEKQIQFLLQWHADLWKKIFWNFGIISMQNQFL